MIIAALQYFTMILNAMTGITRIFVMWSKGEASAKRVAEVLEMPEDLTVLPQTETPEELARLTALWGEKYEKQKSKGD